MTNPTTRDVDGEVGSQATVREMSVAGTVREGSPTATVRETIGMGSRGVAAGPGLVRLPEGLASHYRIERELPTRGNEADLFVVHPVAGGAAVVVKLYRANVHPKEEVQARIAALDGRHVIRQIEYGVSEGRSYEVIEYAAGGSLADLLREVRLDGAMLRAMVTQVAAGLGYLHGLDPPIVHRDVKPDNVLVRRRDPLDLVLSDFGLASVLDGGSWRASTADRTIKYAAPEASAGQVSREMDWWSLGMMVAEATGGRHPFAGVSEQAVAIHYSNRMAIPLDEVTDDRTRLLCLGLLSYDRKQRWGAAEVARWLAGDVSLRPPVVEAPRHAGAPFKFAGGTYGTVKELAGALAGNWSAAQRTVARADGLLSWLKDDAKEHEAWQWLSEITQDKAQLDAGLKVTLLLPMLDPGLAPMFEGEALTRERLLAEVTAAAEGTDGARTARLTQLWEHLPALAELSPEAAWLGDVHAAVARARTEAEAEAKALSTDAPNIATGTWAFTRHVLVFALNPNALAGARETTEALLRQIPDGVTSWVTSLRAAYRPTAALSWLLLQLEPRLRELVAEMARRAAAAEAAAKEAAAKKAAAEAAAKAAAQAAAEAAKAKALAAAEVEAAKALAAKLAARKAAAILRLQGELREACWAVTPQAGHTGSILSVVVTPDGRHLVTGSDDMTALLWDLATGREVRAFIGHTGAVSAVTVTPDGRHLVTGSRDNTARLWELATGRELRAFIGHKSYVNSVAVTPDGRLLVTVGDDCSERIWDLATGRELRYFSRYPFSVRSVAITPDGCHAVTGSGDQSARLWDLATGRERRVFSGHTRQVRSVAITPDGRHLVTGSSDKTARLWDLATGRQLHVFTGHVNTVHSVAVTPDGRQLVAGIEGSTARLWDFATELGRAFTGPSVVSSVAITPDGRHLVTGSPDKTAQLWDLATGWVLRVYKPMGSSDGLSFGIEGQLENVQGDPDALFHFVRGMDVLTVTEVLADEDETWRHPPPAPAPTPAPAPPPRYPAETGTPPLQADPELRYSTAPRPSMISSFIRRLLK